MRDFSVPEVTLWPIRWVKNAHQATFVHKAQPPLLHVPRELSLMQPGTSQNLIARTALQVSCFDFGHSNMTFMFFPLSI